MSQESVASPAARKTPWHLWVVGAVALLWNASGAFTIMMAQAGKLAGLSTEEAAYYAAQPLWFVVATDIALLSAIAAAIALLVRSRAAIWLFAFSLVAIVLTNVYDFATGASQAVASTGALIVTTFIVVIAVLELIYARVMANRGVLGGAR